VNFFFFLSIGSEAVPGPLTIKLHLPISHHTPNTANYWLDPHHYADYLVNNTFQPKYNNEVIHPMALVYKRNFLRTGRLVLLGGPNDGVIRPWQSEFFGYYQTSLGADGARASGGAACACPAADAAPAAAAPTAGLTDPATGACMCDAAAPAVDPEELAAARQHRYAGGAAVDSGRGAMGADGERRSYDDLVRPGAAGAAAHVTPPTPSFGICGDPPLIKNTTHHIYKWNTFGLRTMGEAGRIIQHVVPHVQHDEWIKTPELFEKYILPYLT
jgi:hypothetical protein